MKVCGNCGDEIATRDGDNECTKCRNTRKRAQRRKNRQALDDAMRSCGLVKVRGAMGGTYWE